MVITRRTRLVHETGTHARREGEDGGGGGREGMKMEEVGVGKEGRCRR